MYEGRRVVYLNGGVRVAPSDVVTAWVAVTARIPATFALGVAQHETDLRTDEEDTETDGTVTTGIFQLTRSEAVRALRPAADLTDLAESCAVFATIMESNLDALRDAAGLSDDAAFFARGGAAYLAWSHNAGLGQARTSIQRYGLDWSALKARAQNGYMVQRMEPYGDDCLTGGRYWTSELAAIVPSSDASTGFKPRMGLLILLFLLLVAAAET